jgi:hypothetical protein
MTTQRQDYKGYSIETLWTEQGWMWKILKSRKNKGDNSKQYGEDTQDQAIARAKQCVDILVG